MRDQVGREPVINLPVVVQILAVAMIAIHTVRVFLPAAVDVEMLLSFAFFPIRYTIGDFPGAFGAGVWSFVTYALLHGDVVHLGINLLWMVAFGPPVAWRFGWRRFLVFCAAAAIGGAGLHLLTHAGDDAPMIGASGVISGLMAGAIRFAFRRGAPLGGIRRADTEAYRQPAMSLRESFSDPRVLVFVGIWLAINLIFGIGSTGFSPQDASIAWQAHIGGFGAGLLLFGLIDPVGSSPRLPGA